MSHTVMVDTMVSIHQHHRQRGDQDTDECMLLAEEGNITQAIFCTVFQLTADVVFMSHVYIDSKR